MKFHNYVDVNKVYINLQFSYNYYYTKSVTI